MHDSAVCVSVSAYAGAQVLAGVLEEQQLLSARLAEELQAVSR